MHPRVLRSFVGPVVVASTLVASATALGACSKKAEAPAEAKPSPPPTSTASSAPSASASGASTTPAGSATPTATVPDDAQRVADGARKAALKCFGAELAKDPKAGGQVTLRVSLANSKATKVEVADTTSSKALTDCVVEAVQKASYPDVTASKTVTVPFLFKD